MNNETHELLERAVRILQGHGAWTTADELRALLAKPATRPQGEPDAIIEGVMTSAGITHAIYASTVTLKHGERVMLYTRPAEQPAPVAVVLSEPTYRLLGDGDIIQEGDETLNDDTATWGKVPMGVFRGMPYNRCVMLPVRRTTS